MIEINEGDVNHWEPGDHSGAQFDLNTVYVGENLGGTTLVTFGWLQH